MSITTGIHDGIPFADYLALDAISSSRLKAMGRSPAYCRWQMDNPSEPTAPMLVGSLVDCMLLEADAVPDRFVSKDWNDRSHENKARTAALLSAGIAPVPTLDYERAEDIVKAVRAHPFWSDLRDMRTQVTAYIEANPGSKCRPDILANYQGRPVLVDLKVCRQATQDLYPRSCWSLWHPHQLAWYRDILRSLGHEVDLCYILAVHPQPPHEVTAYEMTDAMLDAASVVVEKRADAYADCVASGVWPHGEPTMVVDPPAWALPDEVSLFDE